jgi:pyridoxal phosphate enzyme (YggS family)
MDRLDIIKGSQLVRVRAIERCPVNNDSLTSQFAAHLGTNLANVQANIARAAERAGRNYNEITLVAVSKTKPLELIKAAHALGVTHFGENRVQEALPKIESFHPQDVSWHMIGHLQSNKANRVAEAFDYVQSIDSLHVARALDRHAVERARRLPILLQVNIAGEASKEGMTPQEAPTVARQIASLPGLEIQGLMTIAPLVEDPEEVRPFFRALRALRDRLRDELPDCAWQHLSMGMTDDYTVAIEEGATIVRIGRAIFGERNFSRLPDGQV